MPKIHRILSKSILSPQESLPSQNIGIVPVCIFVPYFPHDNIACSSVCHKLLYRCVKIDPVKQPNNQVPLYG